MLNFSSAFGYMHATIRFRHCSSVVFAVNKARGAEDYFTPGNVQVARTFLWIFFSHSINSIQACAFVPMDSRSINTNKPTGIWPTILVVSGFLISICWFIYFSHNGSITCNFLSYYYASFFSISDAIEIRADCNFRGARILNQEFNYTIDLYEIKNLSFCWLILSVFPRITFES